MKRKKEVVANGGEYHNAADQTAAKVKAKDERDKFHQSLYRPPTSEELNELKETENLYKDSLFRMQMKCLLDEVKLSEQSSKEMDAFLHSLHKYLGGLQDWSESQSMSDLSWIPCKVKFPIPVEHERPVKGTFLFKKPSKVKVIGSFLLKTGANPDPLVDVAVEMPADCFHKKDYLNYRYHRKRALYLVVLASHLIKWDQAEKVFFSRMRRDVNKPVLVVQGKGSAGNRLSVQIFPTVSTDAFKYSRFFPQQNNVRRSWFFGEDEKEDEAELPSPQYNASILEDMLCEEHLHVLYNAQTSCSGLTDAIILFKVWLHQRGFYEDLSSFSGFVVSMLMVYLLGIRKVTRHMSSYQIFRVTLQYLASTDWTESGISMAPSDAGDKIPALAEMSSGYKIVFIDPTGYLNLCHSLTSYEYNHVRYEAAQSIQILDYKHIDNFEALFTKKVCFAEKFDHWFRLSSKSLVWNEKKDKYDWKTNMIEDMIKLLHKGLESRVHCLYAKPITQNKWDLSDVPQSYHLSSFLFGLVLNPSGFDRIMEKGPSAETPEAVEFSAFWGPKAELRRFKDGSINKAVVWDVKSIADRMMVASHVVKFLLETHFGISSDYVSYCCSRLNTLLEPRYQEAKSGKFPSIGGNYEEQQRVCEAFDSLSKQIKKLSGLPLEINAIQGTSAVFRLTELFSPRPSLKSTKKLAPIARTRIGSFAKPDPQGQHNMWTPAIEVMLQFESSGKWPNDLAVVQHLKAAFYIKLGHLLKKQCAVQCIVSPAYLDIFKEGYVFRLRVFHYREMALLKEYDAFGQCKKDLALKAKDLDRRMVKLPLHTTMIHGLGHQFPGYRDTVRLAKRWVAGHLLADYLQDEAIELIVASIFLSPAPYLPPICHQSGFLRFLHLLATFDWKSTPLIVNLNTSLKEEDYEQINERFTHNRGMLSSIFIGTPYDKFESIWTNPQPDTQILRRLSFLASQSRDTLEKQLTTVDSDIKGIFRPYLGDYDVLILLEREHVPRHYQAVDTAFLIQRPRPEGLQSEVIPVVDFDPVQLYLKELRDSFSDFARFFYDVYGGLVIGVIWKTKAFAAEQLKVFHSHYRMVITKTEDSAADMTVPDVTSILAGFRLLGRGLVKDVKMVRSSQS